MKKTILSTALAFSTVFAFVAGAQASDKCGATNKADWMSAEAISAKASEMGYDVRKVKAEDGCYEVYAIKDGVKTDIYMNPVTAEIVKVKQNG